jgi:ATP-binding cassette subfamily B protein
MTAWPLRLAISSLWNERRSIFASALCHVCESGLVLLLPALAGFLALRSGATAGLADTWPVLGVVAAVLFCTAVLRYAGSYVGMIGQERAIRAVRLAVFVRAQSLTAPAMQTIDPGSLSRALTIELESIVHFASDVMRGALPAILTLGGAFVMIARTDIFIALSASIAVLLAVFVMRTLARRLRPASLDVSMRELQSSGLIQETLGLLFATRMLGQQKRERERYQETLEDLYRARMRQQRAYSILHAAGLMLVSAGFLGAVVVLLARAGTMPVDHLVSLVLTVCF